MCNRNDAVSIVDLVQAPADKGRPASLMAGGREAEGQVGQACGTEE